MAKTRAWIEGLNPCQNVPPSPGLRRTGPPDPTGLICGLCRIGFYALQGMRGKFHTFTLQDGEERVIISYI